MINDPHIGYSSFLASQPKFGIHGTWDDHDFGGNDRGKEMPDQSLRRDAFLDFLNVSKNDVRRKRSNGVYASVSFGDAPRKVLMLLLDTRSFRDYHCIPSVAAIKHLPVSAIWACLSRWITAGMNLPSLFDSCRNGEMLGEEQWIWLEKELEQSDAQAHIIVSSVQILTTNPLVESWCHFKEERVRLLRLLTHRSDGKNIPGVVLLSGDVHHAEILSSHPDHCKEIDSLSTLPLLEVTSSGLTHSCQGPFYGFMCKPILNFFSKHRSKYSLEDGKEQTYASDVNFFTKRNFGSIQIDWDDKVDPVGSATVNVHDHHGNIVLSTGAISLSSSTSLSEEDILNIAQCDDGHLVPLVKRVVLLLVSIVSFVLSMSFLKGKVGTEIKRKHGKKEKKL